MAVTPSSNALAKLKLYLDSSADPVLSDSEVGIILTEWAIADPNSTAPDGTWDYFDFYGAAEQGWRLKSARAAKYVNQSADGQRFDLDGIREACNEQVIYYQLLRQTGTVGVDGLDTY